MRDIRLWTIQDVGAMDKFTRSGTLKADGRRVSKSFRFAYKVMMDEMANRLSGNNGCYPVWCWYSPRPDLRHKAHLPTGTRGVLIEFEVPVSRVLLSDFHNWHLVLNGSLASRKVLNSIFSQRKFPKDTVIQAVIENVNREEVVSVRHFIAR